MLLTDRCTRAAVAQAKRLYQGEEITGWDNAVGFGPVTRLHQVFRREVGMTPGEYRRQWLESKSG
jgi:AraC-like DNA-binding protein